MGRVMEIVPSLERFSEVQSFVEDILATNNVSMQNRWQIEIIVDEIYSNIVNYSNATKMELKCSILNGRLMLQFKDNGIPYNPLEQDAPDITLNAMERKIGGLGIYMVKNMSDDITYQYLANKNVLTIYKKVAMSRAEQIVRQQLIEPYFLRTTTDVGVELEYPVAFLSGDTSISAKAIARDFFTFLMKNGEFGLEQMDIEGYPTRVVNQAGDSISIECVYTLIEFSMSPKPNINEVEKCFHTLMKQAMDFYESRGLGFYGCGTNLITPKNFEFCDSPFYHMMQSYLTRRTPQKSPDYYMTTMQSIQTHLDVNGELLVDSFNLMCKLDFARALLFSNSFPNSVTIPEGKKYPKNSICARDYNWENIGLPNTGIEDCTFSSIDEMVAAIAEKKIFFNQNAQGELQHMEPVSLNEYFQNQNHPDTDIKYYRSFERVCLNTYHTLEFRGDCTQPFETVFCPVAFNLGLVNNLSAAKEITAHFLKKNQITASNSRLRAMAVSGEEIVNHKVMADFLVSLVDCAKEGLKQRSYGEEKYLEPLYERAKNVSCPADEMRNQLKMGAKLEDIVKGARYKG